MKTVLRTVLSFPLAPFDADARDYITRVERADGQALETGVRQAIDAFVRGCKRDGIWEAIKASCILAGARTLSGALVPLKGTAPTNFNFVSGDYNRKTGLLGNGSTKYLDSNRNNNADPQNNAHAAAFVSTAQVSGSGAYVGAGTSLTGDSNFGADLGSALLFSRLRNAAITSYAGAHTATGFMGVTRSLAASFVLRYSGSNNTAVQTSQTPSNTNYLIYARNAAAPALYSNGRLAFYSIGESLDLALLDARVTTLVNTLNSVIP